METNILVKWVESKFPPIDLNEHGASVHALVNERQSLIDSNRELLELVKWISKVTNSPEIGIKCDKAISNAKELNK